MSSTTEDEGEVRRVNLSFIGVDLLIIKGEKNIMQAMNSGDLYKLGEVAEEFREVPWLFRKFLPTTRLYSEDFQCHFIPNRPVTEEYNITRKFIEENYKPNTVNIKPYAKETARALLQESPDATDEEIKATNVIMGECFARALTAPMLPPGEEIPEEILAETWRQNTEISKSFNPFASRSAKKAGSCIYKYIHENVTTKKGLPDKCVADMAHPIFNSALEGLQVLSRKIRDNPNRSIEEIFGSVGPTETVLRMCKVNTTLRGLLPKDKPMRKNRTIALLNIRSAAKARGDTKFCFGTGTKDRNGLERRCCFEATVLEYYDEVRKEIIAQKAGQ